jgi:hypothetical protein
VGKTSLMNQYPFFFALVSVEYICSSVFCRIYRLRDSLTAYSDMSITSSLDNIKLPLVLILSQKNYRLTTNRSLCR